jgi:DNA-binding transcriptional LysR family regulator
MELRQLRYFRAVAEEGHFGRAARRLRMAQPPLSRAVQQLEREIGLVLFDRSKRRIELTAAGRALLPQVERVFGAVDEAVDEARRASLGEVGRIAIGYPSSVAFGGMTELLRAFRARSPDVGMVVRELWPQAQVDGLKDGSLDVGFLRGPLDEPALASRVVRRERMVVALPRGHALATRKRLSIEALAEEPFVVSPRPRGPAYFDQVMRLCHDAGFTPRIVQEAPQLDVVSFVAAGFGVSILPASVRDARRPGVVFRPLVGSPRADLLVAWRPDETSPVVRDFLETVERVGIRRRSRPR